MKITHVVDSMEVGGAETLVLQLCRLQREQGHTPSVYAVAALGALGEQMQREHFNVQANIGRHLTDSARHFFQLFRKDRPEVVHLHNPTPTIYAGPAARLAGVPRIVSTRHSLVAPPRNTPMERKYRVASVFCDWVVGICDATVANLQDARSAPLRKLVRVYNGSLPVQRTASPDLGKEGFTLLYVGRLEPVKNHPLLLEAFCAAQREHPGLRLWMVGDGTERTRLEVLSRELGIENKVRFWGQTLDVAPFFSQADAFVMSSVSEGLPMSLLQAFSAGLPAIVTDVGGMAEVVHFSQAGICVPPADPAAMQDAILQVARSAPSREAFKTNALDAFHRHFTLDAMADAYMRLYAGQRPVRSQAAKA